MNTISRFALTYDQSKELGDNTEYGSPATIEIGNGYTARLSLDFDDVCTINDFDCYGKVFHVARNTWNGSHADRPEGCDGMAEIITYGRGDAVWWQPPSFDKEDRRRWYEDHEYRTMLRRQVTDILAFGFHILRLEICQGTDAYGRPIVVDYSVIGGIEPFCDAETLASYVRDLAYDIEVPA